MQVRFIDADMVTYTGSVKFTLYPDQPEGSSGRWSCELEPSPCLYNSPGVGFGPDEIGAIRNMFRNSKLVLIEVVPDNENPGKILAAILDEVRVTRKDVHAIMQKLLVPRAG